MNDMYKLACPLILILPAVIHAQQPWFRSSPPDYLWQNVGIPERKQPGLYNYSNPSTAKVIIKTPDQGHIVLLAGNGEGLFGRMIRIPFLSLPLIPIHATMQLTLFIAAVILCALTLALLEIQIEGAAGWAGNLPTWKISNRVSRLFLGSVPFTGYHLYLSLFTLCFLHVPYLTGITPFSVHSELRLFSFYFFLWVAEDFLWFAFNPAFGLKKFRKENIWWHAGSWWIFMPKLYWILLPAGAILYFISLG